MASYPIMKAVEHAKLPSAFRKKYPNEIALLEAGWILQPKYDGCMGIVYLSSTGRSVMRSRTDETVFSCEHIVQAVEKAAHKAGVHGDVAIIGEVWSTALAFPQISGDYRSHSPKPHLLFVMHDLVRAPGGKIADSVLPYHQRAMTLEDIFAEAALVPCIDIVSDIDLYDAESPTEVALRLQGEGGYDGAILRDPNGTYTVGTVKKGEIVKVKPTLSLDLPVTAVQVAQGEKTGRDVYTLTVVYNGVESNVGSGVPHEREAWEGAVVEVECLGVNPASGKLREPRYKGIRHDKLDHD